jgi:hypothetical protein
MVTLRFFPQNIKEDNGFKRSTGLGSCSETKNFHISVKSTLHADKKVRVYFLPMSSSIGPMEVSMFRERTDLNPALSMQFAT